MYERAYAELAERYLMDDDCKSKLVDIVLKTYFHSNESRDAVSIEPLVTAAVAAFDDLMSAEN